jgi:hypothetical protein
MERKLFVKVLFDVIHYNEYFGAVEPLGYLM